MLFNRIKSVLIPGKNHLSTKTTHVSTYQDVVEVVISHKVNMIFEPIYLSEKVD